MNYEHIMGLACTISELPGMLKEYCKIYGKEPGIEISVRFGQDTTSKIDKKRLTCRVFVSKTPNDLSVYGGSHTDFYHQDIIAEQSK